MSLALRIFLFVVLIFALVYLAVSPDKTVEPVATNKTIRIYTVINEQKLTPYGVFGLFLYGRLHSEKYQDRIKGVRFELHSTGGSLDSILKVENDKSGIAISQEDVLYHYLNGNHPNFPTKKTASNVHSIARLFPENLVMWTSKKGNIEETWGIYDFKKVCGGESGSGRLVTVKNLEKILLPDWEFVNDCPEDLNDLDKKTLDVRVQAAGDLSGSVHSDNLHLSYAEAQLLGNAYPSLYRANCEFGTCHLQVDSMLLANRDVTPDIISVFMDILDELDELDVPQKGPDCLQDTEDPYCRPISLEQLGVLTKMPIKSATHEYVQRIKERDFMYRTPYQIYTHQIHSSCHWEQDDLNFLTKGLCDYESVDVGNNLATLSATLQQMRQLNGYENLSGILYPSIRIKKLSGLSEVLADWVSPTFINILLATAVALSLLVYGYDRAKEYEPQTGKTIIRLPKLNQEWRVGLIIVCVIGFHGLIAILVWVSEYHEGVTSNDSIAFDGIPGGIDIVKQHIVSGSVSGKILYSDYSAIWLGLLNISYAAGGLFLSAGLINRLVKWKKGDRKMNYALVVGKSASWSSVKDELIALGEKYVLLKDSLDSHVADCSLPDKDKCMEFYSGSQDSKQLKDQTSTLKNLIAFADNVIVLPDTKLAERAGVDPDMWVTMQLHALRRLCRKFERTLSVDVQVNSKEEDSEKPDTSNGEKPLTVVAEALRTKHAKMLKDNKQSMGINEVICVQNFGGELLVQSIVKPSILKIFEELARTSKNDNEIYLDNFNWKEGMRFADLQPTDLMPKHKKDKDRLPIGIMRMGMPLINPVDDDAILDQSDEIIVIAKAQ